MQGNFLKYTARIDICQMKNGIMPASTIANAQAGSTFTR
jgi:hypothetical protein